MIHRTALYSRTCIKMHSLLSLMSTQYGLRGLSLPCTRLYVCGCIVNNLGQNNTYICIYRLARERRERAETTQRGSLREISEREERAPPRRAHCFWRVWAGMRMSHCGTSYLTESSVHLRVITRFYTNYT